ncbi:hypothetical protein H2248_006182 [Termitomyces sp. 'cryptogamus']|nr:hypothetical protein H2248_006182 [Termitomyces sp. 'cryptogamus']
MLSLCHRALGRALSSSVRFPPLQCSRRPSSFSSTIVQRLRPQPQVRFFTSPTLKARGRPYPHRAYQNHQKPPFLGFLDRIPQNTVFWGIITINGVVFFAWTLTKQRVKSEGVIEPLRWMMDNFTSSWKNFSEGRIWTLITATFSHQHIPHILVNGFTFYFMAKPVLELFGTRKFLFLYMGGGLIASLVSLGWHKLVDHKDVSSLGASGAIYSVVSLLACLAPTMTFHLYGIIPIPAWLVVPGLFAYDTYSAMYNKEGTTDAAGHVGGLLAGIAYYLALRFRIFRMS